MYLNNFEKRGKELLSELTRYEKVRTYINLSSLCVALQPKTLLAIIIYNASRQQDALRYRAFATTKHKHYKQRTHYSAKINVRSKQNTLHNA